MRVLLRTSCRGRWLAWAAIPAAVVLGTLALSSLGSSPSDQSSPPAKPASTAPQRFPLAISPDPIVLGVVPSGEVAETSLSVRNLQTEPLTLERIETSCFCIDVGGAPVRLGSHEATELKVTFDPSNDPDFKGRLSVEVTGYLTDGKIGFQTKVKVERDPKDGQLQD